MVIFSHGIRALGGDGDLGFVGSSFGWCFCCSGSAVCGWWWSHSGVAVDDEFWLGRSLGLGLFASGGRIMAIAYGHWWFSIRVLGARASWFSRCRHLRGKSNPTSTLAIVLG